MKKEKKKRLKRIVRRAVERRHDKNERFVEGEGVVHLSTHGYGFVKINDDDPAREKLSFPEAEVFIPAKYIGDALDGDKVKVNFSPNPDEIDPERGPVGRILEVTERKRETMVGEVVDGHKIKPMSKKVPTDIQLAGSLRGARKGDWVKIKILPASEKNGGQRMGMVVDRIGEAGLISADLDAVCAEFDLMPPYTEIQNMAAAQLFPRQIERRDLRGMPTVTIDPTDAKDFDDAVGVMATSSPDEVILGVHISDVAAYIVPGGEFDKEAMKRGFTAYLPGRTLPMLPKTLTAKISLQEGVDSFAHSVLFTVNVHTGKVGKIERCHSIIHVDKRLNYEEVQNYFDTKKLQNGWTEKLAEIVTLELKIAKIWREERKKNEKFINLELPEIRVLCDEENNKIIGLARKVPRESEELIEEYMLAANSAVAAELTVKHLPGLFRVHPQPDPEKLEEFAALASGTFNLNVGDLSTRENCNKFLESIPNNELKPIILGSFLRSLPRASYLAESALHFGLGKTLYSHFTSPIRRYTDLLVHQQLWGMDANEKWKNQKQLSALAEMCSELESNNDSAFFSANDRLKLRYLDELLGKKRELSYTGIVRKATAAGLLVDVTELGIYGFVPLANLGYGYHRKNETIASRFTKQTYATGDLVHLQLSNIDFSKGSAIFNLKPNRGI